jgi:hypothetical protein
MRTIFPQAFVDQFRKELAVNKSPSSLGVKSHKAHSGCRKTGGRNETSPRNLERSCAHDYPSMNASRSALMTSACVVIMPCG